MKNRTFEKITAVLIIVTCIAGLLFAMGLPDSPSPAGLQMYSVLLTILVLVYYIFELIRLRHGDPGFLYPDVRACLMIAEWNMALVNLVLLGPWHAGLNANYRAAAFALMTVVPAEMVLDWAAGRKKTFYANYVLKSYLLFVPYTAFALIMGYTGNGFGLNSADYPYPFMNASQLGWLIVLMNLLLIAVLTCITGLLFVAADRAAGGRK